MVRRYRAALNGRTQIERIPKPTRHRQHVASRLTGLARDVRVS
jgi:hypothetical protein